MNIGVINNNLRMKTVLPQRKNGNSAVVYKQDKNKRPLITANQFLSFGIAPAVSEKKRVNQALSSLLGPGSMQEHSSAREILSKCNPQLVSNSLVDYITDNHKPDVKVKILGITIQLMGIFSDDQKNHLIEVIEPHLDSPDPALSSQSASSLALLCKKGDRRMIEKFKEIFNNTLEPEFMTHLAPGIAQLGEVSDAEFFLPFLADSPILPVIQECFRNMVPIKGFNLGTGPVDKNITREIREALAQVHEGNFELSLNAAQKLYGAERTIDYIIPILSSRNKSDKVQALKAVSFLAKHLSTSDKTKMKLFIHRIALNPKLEPEEFGNALIAIAKLSEPNDSVSIDYFSKQLGYESDIITKYAATAIVLIGNKTHAKLLKPYTRGESTRAKHIREIYNALKNKPAPGDK